MTQSIAVERPHRKPKERAVAAAPPHAAGMLWFGGWLFTIGFLRLVWWKALLGLVIWPYFIGAFLAR
jgi:hypothetical protein